MAEPISASVGIGTLTGAALVAYSSTKLMCSDVNCAYERSLSPADIALYAGGSLINWLTLNFTEHKTLCPKCKKNNLYATSK